MGEGRDGPAIPPGGMGPRGRGRPHRVILAAVAPLLALGPVVGIAPTAGSTATPRTSSSSACALNLETDAITGAHGTASAIGWAGNSQGVTTCLGGSFFVQEGINRAFGFGIYAGGPTTWVDADGYLPAQITTFHHQGATVAITEFADEVTFGGDNYVAVYSRVAVTNPTNHVIAANPEPSPGLIPLAGAPNDVKPHGSAIHDYVLAVDRFGNVYPWPSEQSLLGAGSFDEHFDHMRTFWNGQLAQIAGVHLPDSQLDNAYRSGFIYTQIARDGNDLNTGVNGYNAQFNHDVIGILANLFTQGDFSDAHALLLQARNVVATQNPDEYEDGLWTYSWPWAIYLLKTGDLAFVKENFSTPGPDGATEPSIEETAHDIAADRTGPEGTMGVTNDIDTDGLWTIDDYEALMGLAAYRYLALQVGDTAETQWATSQYDSLLAATNRVLSATIHRYHLTYLPCSIVQPNSANRCKNPEDANWAAPFLFGRWAWDAPLFGAPVNGPGIQLINATYAYGFGRLKGKLPADTFGGYPSDFYSTAYNAGYGSWGLASTRYRDQGILGYEFMIANSQSGPYSWWESSSAPAASPWIGRHPASGQGSSPHAWGMANANKVLLDSLLAQESNGDLIVGRGVPDNWLAPGKTISVTNFPTTDGKRVAATISPGHHSVTLTLRSSHPTGTVLFQLPSFLGNIAGTSAGKVNQATGTVQLAPGTERVTVRFRHAPS